LKLQGESDLKGFGPFRSTLQLVTETRPVRPLPGRRQIDGNYQEGDTQGLAQFQSTPEMFPMAPTSGFIPAKKSSLACRCNQRDTALVDQIAGLGQSVPLQMLFQFGQPDLERWTSQFTGEFEVFDERLGQRSQLRQARQHRVRF
jgi:hypothetical protein